jgi:hypothetical protein
MKNEKKRRTCRVVLITVAILLLLGVGVPLVLVGISTMNEAQGMDNGGDAAVPLFYGFVVAASGSLLCISAAIVSLLCLAWSASRRLKPPEANK